MSLQCEQTKSSSRLVEIGPVVREIEDFFLFNNVISLFRNYLPLENGMAPPFNKLEFPSHKDAVCKVWLKLAQCL